VLFVICESIYGDGRYEYSVLGWAELFEMKDSCVAQCSINKNI